MLNRHVAVVVIGSNESARLPACLASIGTEIAIIYADSASTDDSVTIARSAGAEVVELDRGSPLTAARGRNAGARKAFEIVPDLEFIQFIDGDCTMCDGWLPAAVDFLIENADAAVVCGRRFERYPERSIYNAMCDREWNSPVGLANACGGDALVRAIAFKGVGGFADDQVAHEEPELCGRLRAAGWRIWRVDAPMTEHDAAIVRLGQYYRRSRRAGLGISQCLDRGGSSRDPQGQIIVRRAMIWAVALPIAICMSLVVSKGLAAVLAVAYPAQILRNGVRNRHQGWRGWSALQVAWLNLVAKFAEAHGILSYWAGRLSRRDAAPINYK